MGSNKKKQFYNNVKIITLTLLLKIVSLCVQKKIIENDKRDYIL